MCSFMRVNQYQVGFDSWEFLVESKQRAKNRSVVLSQDEVRQALSTVF